MNRIKRKLRREMKKEAKRLERLMGKKLQSIEEKLIRSSVLKPSMQQAEARLQAMRAELDRHLGG